MNLGYGVRPWQVPSTPNYEIKATTPVPAHPPWPGPGKHLIVTISQDLNWNNHINNIIGKANRTLGFVKRNVKTRNEPVKELACKTLVRPQVEYASSIWNPYTKQNINKIEMIQRQAAIWVKNNYSPYDSISNMLDGLGWRSLENRHIDSSLVMFYRWLRGKTNTNIF